MEIFITLLKEFAPILALVPLYIWWNTKTRTEQKEHADCLDKIKLEVADHGLKITIHHQNHETLADKLGERFKYLENKVNQFDNIVPEVQALKIKMEHYTVKIDNLIESIKDSKSEQKESMKELKDMIRSTPTHP